MGHLSITHRKLKKKTAPVYILEICISMNYTNFFKATYDNCFKTPKLFFLLWMDPKNNEFAKNSLKNDSLNFNPLDLVFKAYNYISSYVICSVTTKMVA